MSLNSHFKNVDPVGSGSVSLRIGRWRGTSRDEVKIGITKTSLWHDFLVRVGQKEDNPIERRKMRFNDLVKAFSENCGFQEKEVKTLLTTVYGINETSDYHQIERHRESLQELLTNEATKISNNFLCGNERYNVSHLRGIFSRWDSRIKWVIQTPNDAIAMAQLLKDESQGIGKKLKDRNISPDRLFNLFFFINENGEPDEGLRPFFEGQFIGSSDEKPSEKK